MYPNALNRLIAHNVIDGNGRENRGNLTLSGEEAGGEYAEKLRVGLQPGAGNIITNAQARYNIESYFPAQPPTRQPSRPQLRLASTVGELRIYGRVRAPVESSP